MQLHRHEKIKSSAICRTIPVPTPAQAQFKKKKKNWATYRQRRIRQITNNVLLPLVLLLLLLPPLQQAPTNLPHPHLAHPLQPPKLQPHMRHPEPTTPHPQLALPLLADPQHLVGRQIGHVLQALEARIHQHLRRDDPPDRQVLRRVLHDAVAPGVDAEKPPETVEDADVGDEGGEGADGL